MTTVNVNPNDPQRDDDDATQPAQPVNVEHADAVQPEVRETGDDGTTADDRDADDDADDAGE